jgi:hypothetical protein
MPSERAAASDLAVAGLVMRPPGAGEASAAPCAVFEIECLDADGAVKWSETVHNTVFTAGKLDILNVYFGATSKPAAWYLALKGAGTEVAADTLASHASWSEVTSVYSSSNRPTVTFGAASALATVNGQINTSSAVSISITGSGTIAGCGLTQTQVKATNTGVLYNAGDFAASRTVASGDTLNVSVQMTMS